MRLVCLKVRFTTPLLCTKHKSSLLTQPSAVDARLARPVSIRAGPGFKSLPGRLGFFSEVSSSNPVTLTLTVSNPREASLLKS
jgi:hypothetical protein